MYSQIPNFNEICNIITPTLINVSEVATIEMEWTLREKLMFATLVVSICSTIGLYILTKVSERRKSIKESVFKLQEMAFNAPYLEDRTFISGWVDFQKRYENNEVNYKKKHDAKYLQYEQYCEMLFNVVSQEYNRPFLFKSELSLLSDFDFKTWCRHHKDWWLYPLNGFSNDVYGYEIDRILNSWINANDK